MVNISNKDIWYAIGLSAIFVTGCLLFSILRHFLIEPSRRRRSLRRRMLDGQREELLQAQLFKSREDNQAGIIANLFQKAGAQQRLEGLQKRLLQADIYWNASVFLSVAGIMAVAGFIAGEIRGTFLGGGVLALVLGTLPFAIIRVKAQIKSKLVERQMPEVMELLARSLRAGHTLPSAIELASQETPHPLGTELRLAYEEQRLGISMAGALRHMVDRIASQDFSYFVTAVLIQTETGGNLAEIMEKIGRLIRQRLQVKGKIKGLTAEGRLSAIILVALPFFMFGAMYFVQKSYVMILFNDPIGQKMLIAGIVSLIVGVVVLRRMIEIKV